MNAEVDRKGKARGCLPAALLEKYALGALSGRELDRVLDHLAGCRSCSRRFEVLVRRFSGPPESYILEKTELSVEVPAMVTAPAGKAAARPDPAPPVPAPGQVWRARAEEGSPPALFVLLSAAGRPVVRGLFPAAIVSWETGLAGEEDLLVEKKDSTLGLEFIVETWNRVYLPQDRLELCLGKLKPGAEGALRNLLAGRPPGGGFEIGPEVESLDDVRVFFQARELRRARAAGRPEASVAASRKPKPGKKKVDTEGDSKKAFRKVSRQMPLAAASFMISPGLPRKRKRKREPEDIYNKYIKPLLPLAGALAVPLIAHLFFRKLSKKLEKEKPSRPRDPAPSLLLGLSYCGLGKWELALGVFAALLGSPAGLFAGLVFSAWVLSRKGKFREAEKKIVEARKLPEKAKSFEIDFDRIERFIEEERKAEFEEWFDRTIADCVLEDPERLLSSG